MQYADTSAAVAIEPAVFEGALRSAATLPWSRVQEDLPAGWSLDGADVGLLCVAGGPPGVAKLAVGEVVDDGAEGMTSPVA